MSQYEDINNLLSLANQVVSGKEYFVSTVVGRLEDAICTLPHDGAIRTAHRAMSERLRKEGSLATITQEQFGKLYNEVGSLGNRTGFRELLGDLLPDYSTVEKVSSYNDTFTSSRRDSDDMLELADQELVGKYASIWSGVDPDLERIAGYGIESIGAQLAKLGFSNPKVSVTAKNNHFVIFAAEAESPNGHFTTYLPAEVSAGNILLPSVFASPRGFEEITRENLLNYSSELRERTARLPEPGRLLAGLTAVATAGQETLQVTADDESIAPLNSPSLYMELREYAPETLEVEAYHEFPDQLKSFLTEDVRDSIVEAGLSISPEITLTAKSLVSSLIRSAGLKLERVAIDSEFDGGLLVGANVTGSAGKRTIQVPVEVIAGQVLSPSVFMSGSHLGEFDVTSLQSFANDNSAAGIFKSAFSSKASWSYPELYSCAIKSAAYGDFVEVEDAMSVILDQFGPELHRTAFTDVSNLMVAKASPSIEDEDPFEKMISEAAEKARTAENQIKMSSTLMLLYPQE